MLERFQCQCSSWTCLVSLCVSSHGHTVTYSGFLGGGRRGCRGGGGGAAAEEGGRGERRLPRWMDGAGVAQQMEEAVADGSSRGG